MASHNPVIFTQDGDAGFLAYVQELSEFAWKNRLVGHTNEGLLYVDERVSKPGYYEFSPKLLPWNSVLDMQIRRCWSLRGALAAVLLLLMGGCGAMALWTGKFKSDLRFGQLYPFIFLVGGLVFLFGIVRNEIIVASHAGTLRWRSGPLQYKATLPACQAARAIAETNGVLNLTSHA